jgi:outer membrane cobalamin receptor
MIRSLLLLFPILLSIFSFAQTATLKGVVVDGNTNETLIGVTVVIVDGPGIVTNLDGEYSLKISPGSYEVVYRYVGYDNQRINITLADGEVKELDIKLQVNSSQLNDVVISAGKFEQSIGDVPVSIAIIKPHLMESKATVTCEAILDQVPGVQVLENQISIRGGSGFSYGSGSRVLLMVDDIPMLAGDAGDIKWSSLPIENVEQIEVIKGASSVLYGSSALNGVVNIRTAYPKAVPMTKINFSNGFYMAGFGDQKGRKQDGTDTLFNRSGQKWWDGGGPYYVSGNFLHSRRIKENFDLVVGGNFYTNDGIKKGADENRFRLNTNTRWRSKKHAGLSYGLNSNYNEETGNLFFLWHNADSVLIPQGGTDTATTTLSGYHSYRLNIDPFITFIDSSGRKHSLKGRFYNTTNKNNTNQASTANSYYAEYQFQQQYDNGVTFTTGLTNTFTNVVAELYGDHTSNNFAVFTQGDLKWKRFNFTAGLRGEHYKIDTVSTLTTYSTKTDTFSIPIKPVFRIGMTYQLAEETYLRASYGEGYRFPTIAEKFIATNVGGLTLFPNANVNAETGWSAELGIKQGFKIGNFMGYLDLAGFITEYEDMMEFTFGTYDSTGAVWNVDSLGYPSFSNYGFQSQNVEDARIIGGEISVVGKGKIGNVDIGILTGYTYILPKSIRADSAYLETFSDYYTTTTDANGVETTVADPDVILKYRNRHNFKLDIEFTYKKFAIGISNRYNSFMEQVDQTFTSSFLGNLILPGYGDYRNARRMGDYIVDLRVALNASKNSKVSFLMNNALNREYSNRPGNVLPPRTFLIQYSFNF